MGGNVKKELIKIQKSHKSCYEHEKENFHCCNKTSNFMARKYIAEIRGEKSRIALKNRKTCIYSNLNHCLFTLLQI